jgi:hypothetical protein
MDDAGKTGDRAWMEMWVARAVTRAAMRVQMQMWVVTRAWTTTRELTLLLHPIALTAPTPCVSINLLHTSIFYYYHCNNIYLFYSNGPLPMGIHLKNRAELV